MVIKVLGPGCTNCQKLEALVKQAVDELGLDAEIVKVTDHADIMAFGIMSTPGLVVDDEVKLAGSVPSYDDVKRILQVAGTDAPETTKGGPNSKTIIVLIVVALFFGLLLGKIVTGNGSTAATPGSGGATAGTTITSVSNDAVADYDAALEAGKPIYVLFHSMTCAPCVEISEVVDRVMPDYEDRIVFVNAITDQPSAQQLAAQFQFQYIPTSFFLSPDGTVTDSFTGAMDEAQLRGYLDALAEAK